MGVLSQAMMTPIVITVVGCAVITPVLLKLCFGGQPKSTAAGYALGDACFTGRYRTPVPTDTRKDRFERKLSEKSLAAGSP
mgnify:CR=1 FL=1